MPWPGTEPPLDAELTRAFALCLPDGRLAGPLRAYRSLASTQTLARAWAATGAPEGAMVLADYQTAGRGQYARPNIVVFYIPRAMREQVARELDLRFGYRTETIYPDLPGFALANAATRAL